MHGASDTFTDLISLMYGMNQNLISKILERAKKGCAVVCMHTTTKYPIWQREKKVAY
jgi:hypothetical protein